MVSLRALVALLAVCLVLGGCVTSNNPLALLRGDTHVLTSMLPTQNIETTPRADDCYLDIVLDRNPVRPFVVVGRAISLWTVTDRAALEASDLEALNHLRSRACQAGGHTLFGIESDYQDQWITRTSSSTVGRRGVFVRTIRSTALVAVYVDRDGSLATAPNGPRPVIRVPTPLEQESTSVQEPVDPERGMAWDQGITDPWAVPAP